MNSTNSTNNEDITFDLPAREGTQGYVGMFFAIYMRTGALLTTPDTADRGQRLERITQFMISLVAGKEKREMIRTMLQENIAAKISEQQKSTGDNSRISTEALNLITDNCCLEIIGEITDFIDEHVGVSKENKLGSV